MGGTSRSSSSRGSPNESSQANGLKRTFPSECFQFKVPQRSKFRGEILEAKVPKRVFPKVSFKPKDRIRKFSSERSQAKASRRGTLNEVPPKDPRRKFSSERSQTKDLKAKMPTTILTKSISGHWYNSTNSLHLRGLSFSFY